MSRDLGYRSGKRYLLLRALCCTALVGLATLGSLSPAAVSAAESDIPRTASGRPDFSGNYDISTLTPWQRPDDFGLRLELTAEEAAAIEQRAAARLAASFEPTDPERAVPDEGGDVGGYNYFFLDRGSGPVKVGDAYRTSLITDPPDGRLPALSEYGKARRIGTYPFNKPNPGTAWWLEEAIHDRLGGPYDDPESLSIADRCLFSLEGTIPVMPKNYNNTKTVVQTDDHLMILIEWMHVARIIRLAQDSARPAHAPPDFRSRAGDSIGWWDGDILVVETTNFLEESWVSRTLIDELSPTADQRVIERFTRVDADTVLYQFTVESSDRVAPWSAEYTWPATRDKLYEFACHEGNYSMGNTLRGARLLERDALAKSADESRN